MWVRVDRISGVQICDEIKVIEAWVPESARAGDKEGLKIKAGIGY